MGGYHTFAAYYDGLTDNVAYQQYAEKILQFLRSNGVEGGLLLDLACGTGNMSLPMARAGYDVIGVDASPEMLSAASEKAYDAEADILFLCQKMQKLDLYGTIDAAICTLDGINHLTSSEDVQTVFERVSLFMNPNGIFIFDVNTPFKHEQVLADNTFVYENEDVYCVWQNELEAQTCTVKIDLDFFIKDGQTYSRVSESFSERAYDENEISSMLSSAGFDVLAKYDGETFQTPSRASQRVIYIAKKV